MNNLLAGDIAARAVALFESDLDDAGRLPVGVHTQAWALGSVVLALNNAGDFLLTIIGTDADARALLRIFECVWRDGAACTVSIWQRGSWESHFVRVKH